jgi:hypothetical protein
MSVGLNQASERGKYFVSVAEEKRKKGKRKCKNRRGEADVRLEPTVGWSKRIMVKLGILF